MKRLPVFLFLLIFIPAIAGAQYMNEYGNNGQNNIDTVNTDTPYTDTSVIPPEQQPQAPENQVQPRRNQPDTVYTPAPDTVYTPKPPAEGKGEGNAPDPDTIGGATPAKQTQLERREQAFRFYTFGLGPAMFKNLGTDKTSYSFFGGRLWEVNPYAAIKALGEVTTDFSGAIMGDASIGANMYALNYDISPYVGGDLGLGIAHGSGRNAFGFDLGGAIGAQFFRTSTAQMSIEGKIRVLFNDVNNSSNFPFFYALRLGVLF